MGSGLGTTLPRRGDGERSRARWVSSSPAEAWWVGGCGGGGGSDDMADLERDGLSGAHTVHGGAPSCAPSPGLPVCHLRCSPPAVQRQTRHSLSMEATFRNMPRLPLLGQAPHRPRDTSVPCRCPAPSTGPLWAPGIHLGGERGGRGGCFNASYHIRTPTPQQTCPFPLLSAGCHG